MCLVNALMMLEEITELVNELVNVLRFLITQIQRRMTLLVDTRDLLNLTHMRRLKNWPWVAEGMLLEIELIGILVIVSIVLSLISLVLMVICILRIFLIGFKMWKNSLNVWIKM
ncbi:hypothetical protein LWI29_036590 [Acer saccharum]|uniref:Uncharacterized protein n=1 Tax=Acer saccharum TaxID=4024 RepID=A0AA39S765_ACESA|nr:hypothetical protein LWI29_036590 [Acer saccharum]